MPWKNTRGGGDYISCRLVGLTPEYLTLYGLKLKEGRFFDLEKDKDREEKVVLNETGPENVRVYFSPGRQNWNPSIGGKDGK